jgi:hypothetical protein
LSIVRSRACFARTPGARLRKVGVKLAQHLSISSLFLHVVGVVGAMVLLDVYGADGSLFVNGVPLSIKGVNWFGSESYGGPPGGLTEHTIDFYLDFLQEHKFNALRLLFNHQSVMRDAVVELLRRRLPVQHAGGLGATLCLCAEGDRAADFVGRGRRRVHRP